MMGLAQIVLAGCLTLGPGSDSIRAGDLAQGFAGLAAVPADTAIAPAPLPGLVRVFHPAELRRLAAQYGLTDPPQTDICVKRPVAPVDGEKLLQAMRRDWPEARIELVAFSRQAAPEGEIHFPRSGLHAGGSASPAGTLWTGWVQYGASGRFPLWARVRVAIPVDRVVAMRDLPPGRVIEAEDVRVEQRQEAPGVAQRADDAAAPDQVIGKCPRQPIRAGESVRRETLEQPTLVRRGDSVRVVVRNGGAQLELDGWAESSGAAGDTVYVRNPDSARRFTARVEGKGRVIVDPDRGKP